VGILKARVTRAGETTTLALAGELDLAGVDAARERLAEAMKDRPARVVVDLSELTFIDSTGISFLVSAVKRDDGGRLSFVACKAPAVRRVFAITGVAELFAGGEGMPPTRRLGAARSVPLPARETSERD
jgi:anti-sigma B factor antagonist